MPCILILIINIEMFLMNFEELVKKIFKKFLTHLKYWMHSFTHIKMMILTNTATYFTYITFSYVGRIPIFLSHLSPKHKEVKNRGHYCHSRHPRNNVLLLTFQNE